MAKLTMSRYCSGLFRKKGDSDLVVLVLEVVPYLRGCEVTALRALQRNPHLYSLHIRPFLVIFNSDKGLSFVLCGDFVCSIGFLLALLF